MNLVPLYMRVLTEDMGEYNEDTPVELLKQALPFLKYSTSENVPQPDLEDLIAKIEALVGTGSKMSDAEVWRKEMHGDTKPPKHKQIFGSQNAPFSHE